MAGRGKAADRTLCQWQSIKRSQQPAQADTVPSVVTENKSNE